MAFHPATGSVGTWLSLMRLSLSRRNVAWAATDTTDPAAPRFQACRMQAPVFHPSLAIHCRGSAQSLVSIG